ncbi:hypothetical protein HYY73_03785 [Candidatus Woesearchaeota archaeon]|nr:hypothetical protein [Candidatus Woesearchaeota archaeon]
MTTKTELEKTTSWGRRIGGISEESAAFFYNEFGWKAYNDAQKWAKKNNGYLASAHGILEQRVQESLDGPSWNSWLTPDYEEDIGLDAEGRFGKSGEVVLLAIQGGGIMLSSPKRLQEAYKKRTPQGEPSLRQEEISQALAGMLPNGQQIKVYTLQSLSKEDPEQLPRTYAIVAPARTLQETPSGLVAVGKLPKSGLFVMRAGHPTTAEDYDRALQRAGISEYGNEHDISFKEADGENPSWRLLTIHGHYSGLEVNRIVPVPNTECDINDARFVVVVRQGRAGGSLPKGPVLEVNKR